MALEGFIHDTTERKLAEDEVLQAHAMLELILDNIPQRVFWKDRKLKFLGCNKSFTVDSHLLDPQEVVGKTDYELFPHRNLEVLQADERWVIDNDTAKLNCEEPLQMAEGCHWLRTNKVPLHDQSGKVIGVLVSYEDITEHRLMEEKLRDSLRDLERSNQELEQFAYVASHDLQEPLRLISSYTQLLANRYRGKLDSDADEFIEFAVDGANRMQRLIQDLLTYSRVTSKDAPSVPISCEAALREALNNLRVTTEESNAQITSDPMPTVLAAENHMIQLFQNLIGNAIKFRSEEAPKIHIGARPGDESGEWLFSIQDNGIGIAPEFFDRIFAIFQRLHSRRKYAGTGIGLAVCKRIVERHGGKIWVASEPGKGSTFFFTLRATNEQP